MSSPLHRVALSCAAVLFFASAVPAVSADTDPTAAAAAALSTKLFSDDSWANDTGKILERQLSVTYSAHASGTCAVTVHRDATSTYPYLGNTVPSASKALTYYMVPLDKMSDQLAVSNVYNGQQAATKIAGASHAQVFTYTDDTSVPLAGLKGDVEPATVSSEGPVPKYPTFGDAASAKNAIAALAKAAASCH